MKFTAENLIQIYLDGSFTPEAQAEFDSLMRRDPQFAERVTQAVAERLGPVPDTTVDGIAANLDGKIGELWEKNKPSPLSRFLRRAGKMTLGAAALAGLYFAAQYGISRFNAPSGSGFWGSLSEPLKETRKPEMKKSVSFSISSKKVHSASGNDGGKRVSVVPEPGTSPAASGAVKNPQVYPTTAKSQTSPGPASLVGPSGSKPVRDSGSPLDAPGFAPALEGSSLRVAIDNDETQTVSVIVFNNQGQLVRHLFQGLLNAGENSIPWDGKDDAGHPLLPGDYRVEVHAGGNSMAQTVGIQQGR